MRDFYFVKAGQLQDRALKLIESIRMELNSVKKQLDDVTREERVAKGKDKYDLRERMRELTEKLINITEQTKWLNAISEQLEGVEDKDKAIELSLRQVSLLNIPKEELITPELATVEEESVSEPHKNNKKGRKKSA
ncbi:hypothetical protein MTAT_04480 [Moorella thermoacetica]|uniref:Uncharacterized protein n=1 Tax=Neomoorella thermoacetica TaxID=1525 RepID=A0AAC9HJ70_NEOTH|nr:hypothetical protein [Moorella thermoacetica]AOQ24753.1 hypothetical protein Maut_02325 [Moorella thermoacetica]TYL15709.1 hypothetical protein MTAT_04480 [Moorella thermoacetica]